MNANLCQHLAVTEAARGSLGAGGGGAAKNGGFTKAREEWSGVKVNTSVQKVPVDMSAAC